ncbi:MAG: hypothetical protein APR54_06695 [Candidatus Cloacimonas sp. SDB]|nr:MAG: hypothetical protein APR54_06695 [Candidatus Cloacimonas sp. SDB]
MKKYSIIIPAYNEEDAIEKTILEISKLNSELFNILIVNDGSHDNTQKIIEKHANIKLINHPYNKGYGASLKTGIRNSNSEYIIFFDSDGQHQITDLLRLCKNSGNYEMLVGERSKTSHQEWIRKPGKWILSKIANFLVGRKIPDLNSGLRITKRKVLMNVLHLLPDGFSLTTTLTIALMNMGYNVGYLPIEVKKRIGKSTVKQIKHGSNTILLIIRLIVLFNPLKVFIPVSLILIIVGSIYEILFGIILFSGRMRLIPGAFFLILTGIIIFFFGLVVDQISELRKTNLKFN